MISRNCSCLNLVPHLRSTLVLLGVVALGAAANAAGSATPALSLEGPAPRFSTAPLPAPSGFAFDAPAATSAVDAAGPSAPPGTASAQADGMAPSRQVGAGSATQRVPPSDAPAAAASSSRQQSEADATPVVERRVLAQAEAPHFAAQYSGGAAAAPVEQHVRIWRLTVPINKSSTLRIDRRYSEVLVGNAEIADVMPLTDRTVYVLGKKPGTTRISILDDNKQLVGVVEVEVAYDIDALRQALRQHVPNGRIEVSAINGTILLTGLVPDAVALESAVAIAQQFAPDAVNNSLVVEGGQEVMLEVRFVEATRRAARDLGINWQKLTGNPMYQSGWFVPGSSTFPSNNIPFGSILQTITAGGASVDLMINALEERGLARRLAEPNLVALSGETASFLAGGEFPFPVGRDNNTITIEFKKFGVGLAFTPTVLSNGLINLKIEPEVSEIDPTNTLNVNGTTIPGLVTRRAKTTVELRDGQSFAIAGLLQTHHRKDQNQLPWIGQVPVLGTLFRSASYEKNETDLVIIVTPRLVRPVGPEQKLVTPADKVLPSNDVEFFLNGKQELPAPTTVGSKRGYAVQYGHIMSLKASAANYRPADGLKD